MSSYKTIRGFTLIELMITLVIAAIGFALAYPSFTGVIRSNRVATGTNGLLAAFNLARTEAIRSNRGSGVCPSPAGASCSGTDWNAGIAVFSDNDASGTWTGGDAILRYAEPNGGLAIAAIPAGGGNAGVPQVAFDRRGRVANGADVVVTISDCPAGKDLQRRVAVTRTGQTRMTREDCP